MQNPLEKIGNFVGRQAKTVSDGYRSGAGKTLAADGVGHAITKGDRTRRVHHILQGITASADRHQTKHDLGKLREICRMYDRQTSLFSGILDRGCDNIVGSNFTFIPKTGDRDLNKLVKKYIAERMKKENCDAAGVMDLGQILKTTVRAIWNDGDSLLVKRSDGTVLGVEADQIVTPEKRSKGKRVVLGVELNNVNRPLAYHIKQRNSSGDCGSVPITANSTRVPAANAIFTATRKRFGQTRGCPFLAAILEAFDRTNNYIDYESLAAEINAMMGWKLTKKEGTTTTFPGEETNPDAESSFEKVQKMELGFILELLEGEDLDMVAADRPGDNFTPYTTTMLRIVGVGIGYPLELLLLDFSKTNFSSGRLSRFESQRMFRGWQKVLGDDTAMPWFIWQIARGIASGELPARPELFIARPQWPAWEDIDPKKSAEGNKLAIAENTKTASQCIRELGGDPDELFEERAEELKKWEELGITPAPATPAPPAAEPEEIEPEDQEDDE